MYTLGRFSTFFKLNGEYLRKETWYRQSGKDIGNCGGPLPVSKLQVLWPPNGLKWDRHFYPLSVNSAFYFIARLRTQRSANRTQSNFATYWEVNRICKRMLNILRGSLPKNWGAKSCLFCDGSHLDKTMPDDQNRAGGFAHLP